MLIVICGLPGVGKSQVAKILGKKFNGEILSTDILRQEKDHFKKATLKKRFLSFSFKKSTYQKLFLLVKDLIKNEKNLILDGTFFKKNLREKAKDLAKKFKTKFILIEVICDEKEVKKRIEKRFSAETLSEGGKKGSESTANYLVYKRFKKIWQPIKEKHLIIDNSKDLKWLKKQIEKI